MRRILPIATTPGTWAKHRLTSTVGPPSYTAEVTLVDSGTSK